MTFKGYLMNKQEYESLIDNVADFPKEGVIFKDISPLLKHKLDDVIADMGKDIDWSNVDVVIGIESRGFILGSAMAIKFNKGFLPVRKKGKLPPPVIGESYELEYGSDTLEMRVNDEKLNVVVVDDVLATGGTLKATMSLCEKNNFHVTDMSVLINLKFLNSFEKEGIKVHSVLSYE
jgi:adenine phosphoribosyltransferase